MDSPSLNANNKPSWRARLTRGIAAFIHPEEYAQSQGGPKMTRYGIVKVDTVRNGDGTVRKAFGEFEGGSGNQFVIERPNANMPVDPSRALENNRGFVYAAVNAKAREVMTIDWRLFQTAGKDTKEQDEHDLLDLLDAPNDTMDGLDLKYLTSALLDITGDAFWYLDGVAKDLDKPKAIYLMPTEKVTVIVDKSSWPYRLVGYEMRLDNGRKLRFAPYQVVHFKLPNASDFFRGYSPVAAGAQYIDNDHYAMEFNRKFFVNGARPAGFLESDFVAETQLEALKMGFIDTHGGIENMNRIGVLPKGVKWSPVGSNPKDMDFKNMSEDMRDRILAMFGVSRTILGTAESDTNRATAETADYVFSKRVVKPHMTKMCATLNASLVGRYGDDLYISFIDPVPEDKAFRNEEMKTVVGSQPVMTVNEARDEFMGLGPVEGGDALMVPNTMTAVGETPDAGDVNPSAEHDPNAKRVSKDFHPTRAKAANGERVAFRPARTKLQKLAKKRATMREELAAAIKTELEAKLNAPGKKFESTKDQDEARWKEWSDYVHAAEKDVAETVRKINAEQKAEVLENLASAVQKAVNQADLFDIDKWISITTDALTPLMETLFGEQAKHAATEVGSTFDFTDTTREAVKRSVKLMAESYQKTTLETLAAHIDAGVQAGESLDDITKRVEQVYDFSDDSRAAMVAKTESFRTANDALKTAWQESGVVKTVKWYTANNPCDYCAAMSGKTISVDDVFFKEGDTLTVGEGDNAQSMTMSYGDVGFPPLHPHCMCFIRPDEVAI